MHKLQEEVINVQSMAAHKCPFCLAVFEWSVHINSSTSIELF